MSPSVNSFLEAAVVEWSACKVPCDLPEYCSRFPRFPRFPGLLSRAGCERTRSGVRPRAACSGIPRGLCWVCAVLEANIETLYGVATDVGRAEGEPVRKLRLLGRLLVPVHAGRALPLEVAMVVKGCALFRGLSSKLAR
jgi:hypothetical protein